MNAREDAIPIIEPGQTMGPFEIRIPHEIVVYAAFMDRTSRWERLRLRLRLMRRERRLRIWKRLVDVLDFGEASLF